ncbi:MAG: type II toxin-antitoxin system PemK/MazF family toxin [Gemmatimonadota bacterium]
MAYLGSISRWELFWVDLEPRVGSEQGDERRPALVISNDGFNAHFEVVTVIPLTRARGKKRRAYPFEVLLPGGIAGNAEDSIAMPQQIRTISRERLLKPIGVLSDPQLQTQIESRLLEHLGIEFEVQNPA